MSDDPCKYGKTSGDTCLHIMHDEPCICELEAEIETLRTALTDAADKASSIKAHDPGQHDALVALATAARFAASPLNANDDG